VEFMAWVSTCLCSCCGGEYSHDDDCQSDWFLRRVGWDNRLTKGNSGELLRYQTPTFLEIMLTGDLGLLFVVAVVVSLFIGTQVMFEIREDEKRRGINLRC